MQGQKSGINSLPETLSLERGYSSTESSTVVEQQICWNNYIRNPSENYISPINTSENVTMWTMGESSSSSSSVPNQVGLGLGLGQDQDHGWLHHHEPPPAASMLSLGDVNMNITHNHTNNGHHDLLFVQNNVNVNPSTSYMGSNATNSTSFSNPLGQQSQLPSKRKAAELGQSSSGVGSSTVWRSVAENPQPAYSNQTIPRLGLGVSSDNHTAENRVRRNVRLRINTSRQQDPLPLPAANNNNNNFLQLNHSAPFPSLRLNPVDLQSAPPPAVENSSNLRRNLQISSRWNRSSSSSRANRSANIGISGDYSNSRTNISDHPIFIQPNDVRSAAINGNGGAATATRISSNSVPAESSAVSNLGPHRSSPHYHPSRRLSEILRRSLLSSIDSGGAGGGQIGNLFSRIPPVAGTSSQEAGIPPLVGRHPRSSDYVARSVAAGSEGRGRLVSEIRNVLDLIRRGEGLRFEDVMLLDQSVFYGMADIHDRHRDMRLDIDNMSYEELLALEERIGNVNTGLTEETISDCLKKKTYAIVPDAEPCCICQEEYKNGDDIGGLECGHDFHRSCIKKWLVQKNLCPVCKSAAIATTTTTDE